MECFVYGTLTDRETASKLLDTVTYGGPAVLDGLHRVDGQYPTLLPGGSVEGRMLQTDQIERLDRYEGVEQGLYSRITVPTQAGDSVDTYVGDPARLGIDADWPGAGLFASRVRAYVQEKSVVVRREESG